MLKRFCQSANLATLSGCSCWNNEKITIHQAHTKQLMETEKETYEINQLKHRNKWHIWKSSWNWQRWKMMDAGVLEWKEAKFSQEKYDTGWGKWQEAGHVDRCVSLCSAETSRAALKFPADTFRLLIRYLAVSKPANLNKHSPMFSRRLLVQK